MKNGRKCIYYAENNTNEQKTFSCHKFDLNLNFVLYFHIVLDRYRCIPFLSKSLVVTKDDLYIKNKFLRLIDLRWIHLLIISNIWNLFKRNNAFIWQHSLYAFRDKPFDKLLTTRLSAWRQHTLFMKLRVFNNELYKHWEF